MCDLTVFVLYALWEPTTICLAPELIASHVLKDTQQMAPEAFLSVSANVSFFGFFYCEIPDQ